MPGKVEWYDFPNFGGAIFDVKEWISNFVPQIVMAVITYPWQDEIVLEKGAPGFHYVLLASYPTYRTKFIKIRSYVFGSAVNRQTNEPTAMNIWPSPLSG